MVMKTLDGFVDWFNKGEFTTQEFPYDIYTLEMTTAVKKVAKKENRKYVGASSLGKSGLITALKILNFPGLDNGLDSVKSVTRFHFGNVFESYIISLLKAYGIEIEEEQGEVNLSPLYGHDNVDFKGHFDVLTKDGTLIEIETMSDSSYKSFKKEPNNYMGYYSQLAFYYHGLKVSTNYPVRNAIWLIYNKDKTEVSLVQPNYDELYKEWASLGDKMYYLNGVTKIDDVLKFPVPELKPEFYKKKETSRYELPRSFKNFYYASCFYSIYRAVGGYGNVKEYARKDVVYTQEEIISNLIRARDNFNNPKQQQLGEF